MPKTEKSKIKEAFERNNELKTMEQTPGDVSGVIWMVEPDPMWVSSQHAAGDNTVAWKTNFMGDGAEKAAYDTAQAFSEEGVGSTIYKTYFEPVTLKMSSVKPAVTGE